MQFGLAKYLMRETDLNRDVLRSLFTVNVMMSLLYTVAILLGAYAAGRVFASREVGEFLFVFSIFPLFAMMEFVPAALCARDMRFQAIASMTVVRVVVTAGVTLFLALHGFAYMSFAWAQVVAWAVTAVCFNVLVWRPDVWRPRFKGVLSILQFGAQMVGISGITQLSGRGGEMLLGSFLGLASLGLYTRAASLPAQLYGNIYVAGSNVIFSSLSKDLREHGDFQKTYVRFMRLILAVLWPMLFGLAVLAQPVVQLLYGAKWQAAAMPLSLLTVATAITLAIGMTSEVFILRHATQRQIKIESVRAVAGFVLFGAGALISLPAAAAAKMAEAVLAWLLYRRPMAQMVGGPKGELRRVYLEGSLLSIAAILPSVLVMISTGWSPDTPLPLIMAGVAAGSVLWAMVLVQHRHPIAGELERLLRATAVSKLRAGPNRRSR
jgi:O-antigen/teichoic acid export membrane protein